MGDQLLLYLAGICVIILIGSMIRDKKDAVLTFFVRALFGILGIYFMNKIWLHFGIMVDGKVLRAGLNFWTVGICGVLGLPGMILIYAVLFFG